MPDDAFCALDQLSPMTRAVTGTDLASLLEKADNGMRAGVRPCLAEGAMGGTYFFRDMSKKICVVFKPSDEEPMAPNNPHQLSHKYGSAYKGHITPGFGMFRELATYIIDRGLAGVPPTAIARARHQCFSRGSNATDHKIGSVQSYLRHECSAEEMGPSKFDTRSVQTIAILDLRLCNQDRHPGNLLVCEKNPYRTAGLRPLVVDDLTDSAAPSYSASVSPACSSDPFPFHLEDIESLTELVRESSSESIDLLPDPVDALPSLSKKRPSSRQSPVGSPHNPRTLSRCTSDVDVNAIACPFPLTSPLRRSVASRTTTESSLSSADLEVPPGKYALAPIDHGYCLPHVLYTGEAVFAWLDWPQANEPLPADLVEYVQSLNVDEEADAIRRYIGAALPPTALLTLKVCTYLLQKGVAAGWTLSQIGHVMVREEFGKLSKLEVLIKKCMNKIRREHGEYDEQNPALSPRQRTIAEDERLLCEYSDKFVGYVQTAIDELVAAAPTAQA